MFAAAIVVKPVDIDTLAEINRLTRQSLDGRDWEQVTIHEIEFHRLIADQTENPILILVLDFVETLLDDFKKILKPDTEFMNAVLASHETIYDAIAEKNGELASAEMLEHVRDVDAYLARLKREKHGSRLWHNCLHAA